MTSEPTARVRVHRDGPVAHAILGTGQRRNALTAQDWHDLRAAFDTMADDHELGVAVVRGAHATFSSGADIAQWHDASQADVDENFALMEAAFSAIERAPLPSIAVIEGIAAGAGCELALACDIQIAAATARIGMPIARLGILLSPAFAARMMTLVGPSRTLEMIYSGRLISAREAAKIGMLTRVVDDTELDNETHTLITTMLDMPAAATRAAKSSIAVLLEPLRHSAERAARTSAVNYPDFRRGVDAFLAPHLNPAPRSRAKQRAEGASGRRLWRTFGG